MKTHSSFFCSFFNLISNYSELVMLLQSDIIFLLSSYYRSCSIVFVTGFSSLVIVFICSLLFFFSVFSSFVLSLSKQIFWLFWRFFGLLGLFLCYQAIDLWCTNSPMIIPFGESCRCSCGYADCTDWLLLFDSFIDFNNGCRGLSLFSGL